jgi:hypothetical protein
MLRGRRKYKTAEEAKDAGKLARRQWYLNHKELCDTRTRAWQARNRQQMKVQRREYNKKAWATMTPEKRGIEAHRKRESATKRKYGMTHTDYNRVLQDQGGHCALCQRTPDQERYKHLNWDHDPISGLVRGLLCTPCNHGLGLLGDTAEGLKRALAYVNKLHCPADAC